MTLTRLADDGLDKYGEYVALAFEGRQYTNLDQQRSASRLAHALGRLGVAPGDRVVVMLPNCPEVIQSYGAILKCGAVIVPVIFLLGDREVAHILADSEAKVVITSTDMRWKVEGQLGVLPTLHHVLLADGGGDGRTRSLAEETAAESPTFTAVDRSPDDLAVILYTSGTTGVPKGVALSHANLESNTRAALLRWFHPEAVLQAIQEFRAVSMSAVPTMLVYLLNYPDAERFDTSSMRVWGSGAAPLPTEIVEPFEKN